MHVTSDREELQHVIKRLEDELIETKRQREILQRKMDKFTILVDAAPMAMMLHQDDRWSYINRAAENVIGYPANDLLDMHFLDWVHPDDRGVFEGKPRPEAWPPEGLAFKIRTKDGRVKWVRGVETPVMLGGQRAGVISLMDMTELKKAEEALRASEEKYRLLVETATDVIFTMDAQLRITYISPTVTRLRGLTVEEAMAQSPVEILTPMSYAYAMNAFEAEMRIEAHPAPDRNRIRVLELEEYCKDGSTIWTESIFNAIRNEEGKFIGMLGITRDITARKLAAKEREHLLMERQRALSEIKVLSGMLPICSACKKIRDDGGYWNQIETYIKSHSEADFSHGLCPECIKSLYPKPLEQWD